MYKMMKVFGVSVLSVILLSTVAFGVGSEEGSAGPGGRMTLLPSELQLSNDQLEKINGINNQYKQVQVKHAQVIQPVELKIEELLLKDTVDYDQVRGLLSQCAPEKVEVRLDMIRHQRAVESVLTAEQRAKLKELRVKAFRGRHR